MAQSLCRYFDVYYVQPSERGLLPGTGGLGSKLSLFDRVSKLRQRESGLKGLRLLEVRSFLGNNRVGATADFSASSKAQISRLLDALKRKYVRLFLFSSRPQLLSWHMDVYDRVGLDLEDPWFDLAWGDNPYVRETIVHAARAADFLTANGETIQQEYVARLHRAIVSLPNGISESFLRDKVEYQGRHEVFDRGDNRFKALFVGHINDRIDYEDMLHVVGGVSLCDFHFVGHEAVPRESRAAWKEMLSRKNCFLHPPLPHSRIPDLVNAADCLLLPYSRRGGKAMFPGKLLEYLSACKPILSPHAFPVPREVQGGVFIYSNATEMIDLLRTFTKDGCAFSQDLSQRCLGYCKRNLWQERAKTLYQLFLGDE